MNAMNSADIIFRNGKIITVDKIFSISEAVAIKGERLVDIGNWEDLKRLNGPRTRVVDLCGRTMIPGIIDSHNHQLLSGLELMHLQFSDPRTFRLHVSSVEELLDTIRDRTQSLPKGTWIESGGGWHENRLREKRIPTLSELDRVAPDHPLFLKRGGHMAILNSYAFRLTGINKGTPSPLGGRIVKDPSTGEPSGVLFEEVTFQIVRRNMPSVSLEKRCNALRVIQKHYNRVGITSVVDPGLNSEEIRAYQVNWENGELTVRTNIMVLAESNWSSLLDAYGIYTGFGDKWLRIGAMKVYVDGAAEGALQRKAYVNDPNYFGIQVTPTVTLKEIVRQANLKGWQFAAHAAGGAATDLLLDAYEEAHREKPISTKRFIHIHPCLPSERNLRQMTEMGIISSVQPSQHHILSPNLLSLWGREWASKFYPYKELLGRGLCVAAGSDAYMLPYNPFLGIWAAVTRKGVDGQPLGEEFKVSREEALRFYTINGAYLTFEEGMKGSIEPGKLADLVVLSKDILTCPEDEVMNIEVLVTIVGGKVVHLAPELSQEFLPR